MRFLFTCGGTAGHINPALGVAGRLRELMPDAEFLFVGAHGNMETELVPREGYALRTVDIAGFQRSLKPKMIRKNLHTAAVLEKAVRDSREIIREFKPDAAIGTGGYVCYPVLRAAAAMGIPTAVHESNAVPGLTTKLLQNRIDRIMVGFEESRPYYRCAEKVTVTGTPVRVDFRKTDRAAARAALGIAPEEFMVLAAFGSLGAAYMNGVMEELIDAMGNKPAFRLVYATGKRYYEQVTGRLREKGISSPCIDVREYIYDMPLEMTAADVMICRGGASTISELTYLGKPAILVPSPNVVNHHQEKNAAVLAEAGAARMLSEGHFNGKDLLDEIEKMRKNPDTLADMEKASRRLGVPDATDRITAMVLELAQK